MGAKTLKLKSAKKLFYGGDYIGLILHGCNIFSADTSKPIRQGETDGDGYYYVMREDMERDIKIGKYVEHGEYDGQLFGTKYDSVRHVIRKGKMSILDLNAQVCWLVCCTQNIPIKKLFFSLKVWLENDPP